MLHVRICAGGRPQGRSLPRPPVPRPIRASTGLLSFVACVSDEATLQANRLRSPCLGPGTPHEIILLRNCRSAAEVKAIASGNPAVLTLAEADAELQRQPLLNKNHQDEQYLARRPSALGPGVPDAPGGARHPDRPRQGQSAHARFFNRERSGRRAGRPVAIRPTKSALDAA